MLPIYVFLLLSPLVVVAYFLAMRRKRSRPLAFVVQAANPAIYYPVDPQGSRVARP